MKTREVVEAGYATPGQIVCAIRNRRIPAPEKDCSGDYRWSEDDIRRLRQVVLENERRRRPAMAAR